MNKVSTSSKIINRMSAAASLAAKGVAILVIPAFFIAILGTITVNAQTLMDTGAATSIGATVDSGPAVNAGSIREKIRADIEARSQNFKNNQETRNIMVEKKVMGSTSPNSSPLLKRLLGTSTPPKKQSERRPCLAITASTTLNNTNTTVNAGAENEDCMPQGRPEERRLEKPLLGSTTLRLRPMEKGEDRPQGQRMENTLAASTTVQMRINERKEGRVEMNMEIFRQRKENAAKQFEVAVNNLTNLRARIGTRIEKESQNGRDMTKAKQLLVTADQKLSQLKVSIDALKAFLPATSTQAVSTSTITTNLENGRTLVENVQKSIRAAQKSLTDVVVEIARSSGFKLGNMNAQATTTVSTQTTISSSPSVSPSTI